MTKEEKQELLDKLERAYLSGHVKVKNGDKEIQYNTPEQMKKVIDGLRIELGLITKTSKRIYPTTSKGLSE